LINAKKRRKQLSICTCETVIIGLAVIIGLDAMVINATFNNISAISWRSVVLLEKTWVPAENNRPVASHWQTYSHNVVSSAPRHERDLMSQS